MEAPTGAWNRSPHPQYTHTADRTFHVPNGCGEPYCRYGARRSRAAAPSTRARGHITHCLRQLQADVTATDDEAPLSGRKSHGRRGDHTSTPQDGRRRRAGHGDGTKAPPRRMLMRLLPAAAGRGNGDRRERDKAMVDGDGYPDDYVSMKHLTPTYNLDGCELVVVRDLCERFHGDGRWTGNSSTYAFAVWEEWDEQQIAVAAYTWQPPAPGAARSVCPEAPHAVLALSRMVALPKEQRRLQHVSRPLRAAEAHSHRPLAVAGARDVQRRGPREHRAQFTSALAGAHEAKPAPRVRRQPGRAAPRPTRGGHHDTAESRRTVGRGCSIGSIGYASADMADACARRVRVAPRPGARREVATAGIRLTGLVQEIGA